MHEVIASITFEKWLRSLRDRQARSKVLMRITRLRLGNPGVTRAVGNGIRELKIDHGPGYRVYVLRTGGRIVLLCGGDKRSQRADIERASRLAETWRRKP